MNTKLQNRIANELPISYVILKVLDRSGYAILAFVAIWASARFSEWQAQFLVLAVILGLRWALDSKDQVIRIFTHD